MYFFFTLVSFVNFCYEAELFFRQLHTDWRMFWKAWRVRRVVLSDVRQHVLSMSSVRLFSARVVFGDCRLCSQDDFCHIYDRLFLAPKRNQRTLPSKGGNASNAKGKKTNGTTRQASSQCSPSFFTRGSIPSCHVVTLSRDSVQTHNKQHDQPHTRMHAPVATIPFSLFLSQSRMIISKCVWTWTSRNPRCLWSQSTGTIVDGICQNDPVESTSDTERVYQTMYTTTST